MSNTTTLTAPAIVLTNDDTTAMALVATIKGAVNGTGKYAAYVTAHNVTRDNVKDHARALAVLTYPNDAPVQKKDGERTRFGNAVQAAGFGLRKALGSPEPKPVDRIKALIAAASKASEDGHTPEEIMEAVKAALGE